MIALTTLRRLAIAGCATAVCVCAAVATGVAFAPANAQTPDQFSPQLDLPQTQQQEEKQERYGDWMKKCETKPGTQEQRCYLRQLVIHEQDEKRNPVLLVAVGYYGDKGEPGVILRVPLALGIYLPDGLTLTVPNAKPVRVALETCLPGGCSGSTPLPEEVIAAMKKSNGGTVDMQNIRKQRLKLPVSFKGFTAGLASLDKG